jgi:epoxyqueuosine reductase
MPDLLAIKQRIAAAAEQLGFDRIGVSNIALPEDEAFLQQWLAAGRHGEMRYMQRHGLKRSRPELLVPGTVRVLSARMHYWPEAARSAGDVLADGSRGYVSRYALGRDYHKVLRGALQKLATFVEQELAPHHYRVLVDSAPVLEKALARNAGLGWIGKHTNLIARDAGSYFFLGEIYTDLPLAIDPPASEHCGSCQACLPACPTGAIVSPWRLDARRCISYLTIELKGSIPEPLRPLMGNRIYGCDDCQLVCPWNKFARPARDPAFEPRHGLDAARLVDLMAWSAHEFEERLRGSPIRRIGHERWLRNIAVALGNAPRSAAVVAALESRREHESSLVREHVGWALARQLSRAAL